MNSLRIVIAGFAVFLCVLSCVQTQDPCVEHPHCDKVRTSLCGVNLTVGKLCPCTCAKAACVEHPHCDKVRTSLCGVNLTVGKLCPCTCAKAAREDEDEIIDEEKIAIAGGEGGESEDRKRTGSTESSKEIKKKSLGKFCRNINTRKIFRKY